MVCPPATSWNNFVSLSLLLSRQKGQKIKMIIWTSNITGNENMTLDATRRYSTLLDAARRYLTLLDAIQRHTMLFDATLRYSMLFDATQCYPTLHF
jgi:hypothetical protein